MEALEGIEAAEELGRGVSSSGDARKLRNTKAKHSRAKHYSFLPRKGVVELSVDRLSLAGPAQATAIADNRDRARDRKFYGWLVVGAMEAAREGR